MSAGAGRVSAEPGRRSISIWAYIGVVVVYLAIIQGLGLLLKQGLESHGDTFPDSEFLLRVGLIPVALSLGFGAAVATSLGWWPEILHDHKPVRRWVRTVPILLIAAAVISTDYAHLLDTDAGLVALLALLVIAIGCGEELMFRGIGVTAFRRAGFSEGKVALYTSIIFGLAHITNLIAEGTGALLQALLVSFAGYLLYLSRRVGGGLWLAIVVHASWDFGLLSSRVGLETSAYVPALASVLVLIGLTILALRRRHRTDEVDPSDHASVMWT